MVERLPLRIAHVSTSEHGGAGRAAMRISRAISAIGHQSYLVSRDKAAVQSLAIVPDNNSLTAEQKLIRKFFGDFVQYKYLERQRNLNVSNTLFSSSYPSQAIDDCVPLQTADVINLHWVTQMVSPDAIRRLLDSGKKIVWTFHDQWPLTGGCHYSAGCSKYENVCVSCSQLRKDQWDMAATFQIDKRICFSHPNLVVVSPSAWLADCARRSTVFCDSRIEVIRNPIDFTVFRPLEHSDRRSKRAELGIKPTDIVVCFGATTGSEKRKGYSQMRDAIVALHKDEQFKRKLYVLTFGLNAEKIPEIGNQHIDFGKLDSDASIAVVLGISDITVIPSQEDNYPNVMVESLACGTPVGGFAIGGISELISEGKNGVLFGSEWKLGPIMTGLKRFSQYMDENTSMRDDARLSVYPSHEMVAIGRAYEKVYKSLLPVDRIVEATIPADRTESSSILSLFKSLSVNNEILLGPLFSKPEVRTHWRNVVGAYCQAGGEILKPDEFIAGFNKPWNDDFWSKNFSLSKAETASRPVSVPVVKQAESPKPHPAPSPVPAPKVASPEPAKPKSNGVDHHPSPPPASEPSPKQSTAPVAAPVQKPTPTPPPAIKEGDGKKAVVDIKSLTAKQPAAPTKIQLIELYEDNQSEYAHLTIGVAYRTKDAPAAFKIMYFKGSFGIELRSETFPEGDFHWPPNTPSDEWGPYLRIFEGSSRRTVRDQLRVLTLATRLGSDSLLDGLAEIVDVALMQNGKASSGPDWRAGAKRLAKRNEFR